MKSYNQKYEVNYIDELKQALEFLAWFALILDAFMGLIWFVCMFAKWLGLF